MTGMDSVTQQRLLARAEALCQKRGTRLTPQRLEVLRLMTLQKKAISAYDLLDLLRQSEPQAKPPTIYRALDFLLEQGFIHKIESTNSYVLCHHFDDSPHTSALLLCHGCGRVMEKNIRGIEQTLQEMAHNAQFILQHSVVELHGLCDRCQAD